MKRGEDLTMSDNSSIFDKKVNKKIRTLWDIRLKQEFVTYDPDKGSLSKKVGIYTVNYLPGRLRYLKNNPPKSEMHVNSPHSVEDAFCVQLADIQNKQKITDLKIDSYTWRVLANKSPIERYHCVLIPDGEPRNQTMTLSYFEDLAMLAKSANSITLGFNSFGAAASQNHFHFHLFFNNWSRKTIDQMPIARQYFNLDQVNSASQYVDQLVTDNIGHNITMSSEGIVITRRKNEHIEGIRYGVDAISGRFLTTSPEQYESMNPNAIEQILEQIAYLSA